MRFVFPFPFDMHQQSSRQLQECHTTLAVSHVLDLAVQHFGRTGGVYSAFLEKRGPTHIVLRGQGGEEIVIGGRDVPGGSAISGSSYLFDQQIAQFLDQLPRRVEVASSDDVADSPSAVAP